MSGVENGGAAFPFTERNDDGSHFHSHSGMSLRDWFAGQALAGALNINTPAETTAEQDAKGIARACYCIADAMLAERSKP